MKLRWTKHAAADRREIRTWIAREAPLAALSLDERISEKVGLLPSFPELGRPGRVDGTRELVVHPNYIVVYEKGDEDIRVLRVLHAAQPWPDLS